jgi:hypothetical protein
MYKCRQYSHNIVRTSPLTLKLPTYLNSKWLFKPSPKLQREWLSHLPCPLEAHLSPLYPDSPRLKISRLSRRLFLLQAHYSRFKTISLGLSIKGEREKIFCLDLPLRITCQALCANTTVPTPSCYGQAQPEPQQSSKTPTTSNRKWRTFVTQEKIRTSWTLAEKSETGLRSTHLVEITTLVQ